MILRSQDSHTMIENGRSLEKMLSIEKKENNSISY